MVLKKRMLLNFVKQFFHIIICSLCVIVHFFMFLNISVRIIRVYVAVSRIVDIPTL